MSDIFISYAREDRQQAERIAKALSRSWSVWWDPNLAAGQTFRKVIREEINKARCLVVLWSHTSVESEWVLDEASLGKRRGILVPVCIDGAEPPLGFGEVHTADLTGWNGDTNSRAFQRLLQDISALLGPGSRPAPVAAAPKLPRRLWVPGVALLLALVVVGLVYALWVRDGSATVQPVIQTNAKDGLSYVRIAPGRFSMGAVPSDSDAGPEEKPRHRVRISRSFWMGATLVTVAAYKRFVSERPEIKMPDAPIYNPDWNHEDHPMVRVAWDEAQAYCAWAGGPGGRLPSEAEWEYAARAGRSGLKYPWGNDISRLNANYHDSKVNGTSPVRSYPPNAWGLYDMAGNVWEWMADWYDDGDYAIQPPDDPRGPDHATGDRVLRGGSFTRGASDLRVSRRGKRAPGATDHSIGFRCVMER